MINKGLGIVFGAVYVIIGLLGFIVTTSTSFASTDGGLLLGIFEVNPLHNIVHILVGALLILGGIGAVQVARSVNTAVGAVYLLVGILGVALIDTAANILAVNTADNILHFLSALVLAAVGLGVERSGARVAA